MAFHDSRSMGDFIARINYESSSMGNIVVALPPLIQSVLTLVGMAVLAVLAVTKKHQQGAREVFVVHRETGRGDVELVEVLPAEVGELDEELGELSPRRRTIVKMLGNFDTYIVTPTSVRRALSRAVDLREYARKLYVEGSLVFVGFRYGDPDLSALLDRVFGMFEPPRGTHYFLGAGVGPVTVDELLALLGVGHVGRDLRRLLRWGLLARFANSHHHAPPISIPAGNGGFHQR